MRTGQWRLTEAGDVRLTELISAQEQTVAFRCAYLEEVEYRGEKLNAKVGSRRTRILVDRELLEGIGEVNLADRFRTIGQRMNLVIQNRLCYQVVNVLKPEGNAWSAY